MEKQIMGLYRVGLLACLFAYAVGQTPQSDPCGQTPCQTFGYECRLVRVSCAEGVPCPPQPICVPAQSQVNTCDYGRPVLEQTGNQIYTTTSCDVFANNCPDTTECQTRSGLPVCCWTPFEVTRAPVATSRPQTKNPPMVTSGPGIQVTGHCAKTFPLPKVFCQWIVPECMDDRDCLPGSKCCFTDTCERKGCLLARLQPECSFIDKMFGLCK